MVDFVPTEYRLAVKTGKIETGAIAANGLFTISL